MRPSSTPTPFRTRREQIGLSQVDLANTLGVSKSLLSHIEAGTRLPTEKQLAKLAAALCVPKEMLLLASGRLPEDVRQAFIENAAEAVAAVRQHTEANAIAYPQKPSILPLPKAAASYPTAKLPERINAQKTSTSYRAHSYHTKVPPDAIRPFIRAYTQPGDTILDPFCGSGMTGVAALIEGRNALLSDLSPAAVHIARNYTTPCDPDAFLLAFRAVAEAVTPTIDWLYRPVGTDQMVEYTTWSDVYRCPACRHRLLYWDAVHRAGGVAGDRISCLHCSTLVRKASLEWIGEEPVQSHTSAGSHRIDTHKPMRSELALIEQADGAPIPYWTPNVPFSTEREMWRASHKAMGIDSVAGFFTRRNLHALAALRHAIVSHATGSLREALMFAFTAAVNRASRRYQWNAKRPTNVMTGTLYISSLRYEWNVWSLFKRKVADVAKYYQGFPQHTEARVDVFQRSAAELDCLPDRSIDFVFMDPPFGANIFYADSSLLWDAWLGQLTDEAAEIVVNKSRSQTEGGKSIDVYGDLMTRAFTHTSRLLKVGGRAILAFSNSDDRVWQCIQSALGEAGFDTESVHMLNKGQPSIKGVKGVTGKEHVTTVDLMLCLRHRAKRAVKGVSSLLHAGTVDQIIRSVLMSGPHRNDEIYSAVIRGLLAENHSLAGITMPAVSARCLELGAHEKDGRWHLTTAQGRTLAQSEDFTAGYLALADALPQTVGSPPIDAPLSSLRVQGGRSSAFYLAHSYHTKVPPEAIAPFIEHYTKPGDVVLDPFCGSGMTGVAASLSGRRAILNDLSPAAVHLAWNHTQVCDPQALARTFAMIETKLQKRITSLYQTTHVDGSQGLIHWTLWSSKHRCPSCRHIFQLWDVMDRATGRLGATIACPHCHKQKKRTLFEDLGSSAPAWISYETADGKRWEKAPSPADIKHALSHKRSAIKDWFPKTALGSDREMYIRCALHLREIETVADFYTPRNLKALALLWREIMAVTDERIKRALAFAFTNTAWHGTRMRRFNARGGQRPLTGTLYIPQLSSEANVVEVMRNKIAQLQRYYRDFQPTISVPPAVTLGSATDLSDIPDASVDYIFTDPPFGSNIFYADCNFIWESWLGRLTDQAREAVVNRSLSKDNGGKTLSDYAALIESAMRSMARVLKPGGWATVVFHNTDADVWQAIRHAAEQAGFSFYKAASLDRLQQSHKGYKGRSGAEDVAHFDVVFNLRKSEDVGRRTKRASQEPFDLESLVVSLLKKPIIAKHGLQGVHAEVMRRLASNREDAFVNYADVREVYERLVRPSLIEAAE